MCQWVLVTERILVCIRGTAWCFVLLSKKVGRGEEGEHSRRFFSGKKEEEERRKKEGSHSIVV